MEDRKQRLYCETLGDVTVVNLLDRKIVDEGVIQELGEDLFKLVEHFLRIVMITC